jgi:predicted RNA binding protein YcfA (HicA-like mRNA interferase family)
MSNKDSTKKIIALAEQYGFKLIRKKTHLVFRNNKGIQLVTAASASDHRAFKNIKSIIKRLLKNHDSNHIN